jgi:hypothetical protein
MILETIEPFILGSSTDATDATDTTTLRIPEILEKDEKTVSIPTPTPIGFIESDREENVLINSNFNCRYFINRDKLHALLKSDKYKIETAYDPCSYPGVKSKFYFNNEIGFDSSKQRGVVDSTEKNMKMSELNESKKYTEISFMIFRTGSCLIVGNCSERVLMFVYEFIKNILESEYHQISVLNEIYTVKTKIVKTKKTTVFMTPVYYQSTLTIEKT